MPFKFIVGGPCYQMQVDARHAMSVARLCALGSVRGHDIGYQYAHRTPVSWARNDLFEAALKTDSDVLFWCDSDSSFDPRDALAMVERTYQSHYPFVTMPSRMRVSGRINVNNGHGWLTQEAWDDMVETKSPTGPIPVHATGMGTACFHLDTFRDKWPIGPWFYDVWGKHGFMSEDFVFTSTLEERVGYRPMAWPALCQHHPRGVE